MGHLGSWVAMGTRDELVRRYPNRRRETGILMEGDERRDQEQSRLGDLHNRDPGDEQNKNDPSTNGFADSQPRSAIIRRHNGTSSPPEKYKRLGRRGEVVTWQT
jgi:hypothetical protein